VDAAEPGYEYVYGYEDYLEEPLTEDATGASPAKGGDSSKPAAGAPSTSGAPTNGTMKQRLTRSKRVKKPTFSNKEVEFAPAAEVKFGDDIDDEGQCEKEIEKYCKDEDEGDGQLADCISDAIAQSELPGDGEVPEISDACREEVYQYTVKKATNINLNVPLAKSCKNDAIKFCNVTWFFGYKAGQVISCLREFKNQVDKKCKKELFKAQKNAVIYIQADPMVWEACKDDSETLCKGIKDGGGRIQSCLAENRMKLSWTCEEQLFQQELESADDIRLSTRLFAKCMPDKRKFCKDVEPGNARAKDCLEEHRKELSGPCQEEIDAMIEKRVRDLRLDSRLRSTCENEIFNMCAFQGDLDDMDTYDSTVINCLQDFNAEIKNTECKRLVKKYIALASEDIRFDVPLAEACADDRQKFCSAVAPGSARVFRCLTNQRTQLSPICRATLFDEEVRFSENIDFRIPMKEACTEELKTYCKDVPHDNALVISCLSEKKNEKDFGKACKKEVQEYEHEVSQDYRFNPRLKKSCDKDIKELCPGLCNENDGNVCGGKVLRCLSDHSSQIKAKNCQKEVYYFEKMEVSDYKNDIILAEACRWDVDKFCSTVPAGQGQVHKCLREHRKQLSENCRKEELLLEEKESSNIELNVGLLKACKDERKLFCKDVQPGQARVFRCLAENMNDADFGTPCKNIVINKLQRRQNNWKLDPPLRRACREDVADKCAAEDSKNSEDGLVYKCLVDKYEDIKEGCQKELGRAIHMAFFTWTPDAVLTKDCDEDINKYCLAARPNMASRPGAVGSCLANILERQERTSSGRSLLEPAVTTPAPAAASTTGSTPAAITSASSGLNAKALQGATLSDKCYVLADIAEPPNIKQAFDNSLSFALLKSQLDKLDAATGIPLVNRDRRGTARAISLSGWVALLGITAMGALILFGAVTAYRRFRGLSDRDYSLVVKQQHPPAHGREGHK